MFASVSGDMSKIRDHLLKKEAVMTWTPLEDMALTEPDNSVEF